MNTNIRIFIGKLFIKVMEPYNIDKMKGILPLTSGYIMAIIWSV